MNAKDIRAFISAGRAVFTIQSVPTGKHYTYCVTRSTTRKGELFARVSIGDEAYAYLGAVLLTSGKLVPTRASEHRAGAPSFDALAWFLRTLARTPHDQTPAQVIFRHEGKCGRCGRPLTHPESIDSGIGPDCAAKLGLAHEPTRGPSGASPEAVAANGRSLQQMLAERRAVYAGEADRNGDFTDLGSAS